MIHAHYPTVSAVIEYRSEQGAIQPDQWITTQLKEKQLTA